MNKKAQLKIQQMIFMIIAVAIFFVVASLFFFAIRTANLYEQQIELEREKAVGLVTKLAATPEFEFEGVTNGVDFDKIMVLQRQKEYRDYWKVDGIIIEKLHPDTEDIECTTSNYPNCRTVNLFVDENKEVSRSAASYIALCRKSEVSGRAYDKCELAQMVLLTQENEF